MSMRRPITETFVEVHDPDKRRVVTVIELLSESNKSPGEANEQYRQQQKELRRGRVHLVEIDLLRAGRRALVWPTRRFPKHARTVYGALIHRATKPHRLEIYPITLRKPLPGIRIPLRPHDDDVRLELQPLVVQAYRKGRYGDTIDYTAACEPALRGEDAAWADELLKKAGRHPPAARF